MYLNLAMAMKRDRVKVNELAAEMKISRNSFANKMNGKTDFTITDIQALTKKFGQSFESLFAIEQEKAATTLNGVTALTAPDDAPEV